MANVTRPRLDESVTNSPPVEERLAAVEVRLRAIVDAYRDRLVVGSVYGLETLTRPGAKVHDFFAFVKPGASFVSLYLKPVYTWPDLLDDISPALRKRLQGTRTAFGFASVDDTLLAELEGLVERSFRRYDKAGRSADAAAAANAAKSNDAAGTKSPTKDAAKAGAKPVRR